MTHPIPAQYRWRAATGSRASVGDAATLAEAWTCAASAALQLAVDTDGAPLELGVDGAGAPADVVPARTTSGSLDQAATAALLARFLDVVGDDQLDSEQPASRESGAGGIR